MQGPEHRLWGGVTLVVVRAEDTVCGNVCPSQATGEEGATTPVTTLLLSQGHFTSRGLSGSLVY